MAGHDLQISTGKFMTGTWKKNHRFRSLGNVSLVVTGLLIFALFIHQPWPARAIALGGLLAAALLMGFTRSQTALLNTLGLGMPGRRILLFTVLGIFLGVALGMFTRKHFNLGLLPATLTLVALIASLTGAVEELLFRGYIQGSLNPVNRIFALVYAAFTHTAYKLLVIYSLGRPMEFDFLFLARWTLLGGLAFGALRLLSRSVYPPLFAHAVFDILVYGASLTLPFWVWN